MAKLSEKFLSIYEAHRQKVAAIEQETAAAIVELLDEIEAQPGAASPAKPAAKKKAANAPTSPRAVLSGPRVEVIKGDITALKVDAIVNPASRSLQGGGGIEGAIFAGGGAGLVAECRALGGCERGQAKITRGHDLPAKYVIHTVGPVWKGGDNGEPEMLASCYRKSLELALENNVKSIAFPAISCGNFGYPLKAAARVAATEAAKFVDTHAELQKVYLVCFDDEAVQAFSQALTDKKAR